ncbi:helix-turn-helix transcriptional regulator [Rhodococcus oryzae]|uniref:helix-turn-helix transcriptional regulator n=1 Tax=Rhodococcus oryzae TaxID=2571143 RepID=UPI00371037F9
MGSSESAESVFGRLVKRERERQGYSQAELAELLTDALSSTGSKAYPTTIAKIEARDTDKPRAIRLDEAAALARVLGRPLGEMLEEQPDFPIELAVQRTVSTSKSISKSLRSDATELRALTDQLSRASDRYTTDTQIENWDEASICALAMLFAFPHVLRDIVNLQQSLARIVELGATDKESLVSQLTEFLADPYDDPPKA